MANETPLISFYKETLTSIGLSYDEELYVRAGKNPEKAPLYIIGDKTLVLPTQEHIKTALKENDEGEMEITKILYNPLNENVVRSESESLIITKRCVEAKLAHAMFTAGSLLLTIANNPELQKDVNLDISKFLTSIAEADNVGIKELVDPKTINYWSKIWQNALTGDVRLVNIFLAKAGKYNDVKFNRLAKLSSPLLEALLKATKETPIYGIKLRPKDLTVFRLLIKLLLPDMDNDGLITAGSNDTESPAFAALMKVYITVGTWVDKIVNDLATINEEKVDDAKLDISIKLTELDNLHIYKAELKMIPNELDLSRFKAGRAPALSSEVFTKGVPVTQTQAIPKDQYSSLTSPRPLLPPQEDTSLSPEEKLKASLYGGGRRPPHVQFTADNMRNTPPPSVSPYTNVSPYTQQTMNQGYGGYGYNTQQGSPYMGQPQQSMHTGMSNAGMFNNPFGTVSSGSRF